MNLSVILLTTMILFGDVCYECESLPWGLSLKALKHPKLALKAWRAQRKYEKYEEKLGPVTGWRKKFTGMISRAQLLK